MPKKPSARDLERKIRAIRRKQFEEAVKRYGTPQKIPPQIKHRIEREPLILRGVRGIKLLPTGREDSMIALLLRTRPEYEFARDKIRFFVLQRAIRTCNPVSYTHLTLPTTPYV